MVKYSDINDVPKYRKKSKGSGLKKSNHKHKYEYCVYWFYRESLDKSIGFIPVIEYSIGEYCPVCGKIGRIRASDDLWTEDEERKGCIVKMGSAFMPGKQWNKKALKEFDSRTRTLPMFHIEDPWYSQKFINLNKSIDRKSNNGT